ncbi:MAG TPA: M3 family metallopeptidase [Polyangiaceae bacterium]|nr:M3 family metallopeptidase [Polyangiaceae bacterium]
MSAQSSTARVEGTDRVERLRARIEELGRDFAANVALATAAHVRPVDEAELAGMAPDDRERARRRATARGLEGHALTLDAPSYRAALASLDDRGLRKTLYEAYMTRASDRGPYAGQFDNTPLLSEILELRYELARELGFKNYAELALSEGVLRDPDEAEARLVSHHRQTKSRAQAELDELWAFAKEKGVPRGFSPWDLPYYAAWWSRQNFASTEAEVRRYFSLQGVLAGAMELAAALTGVSFVEMETSAQHAKRRYRVANEAGVTVGFLMFETHATDSLLTNARVSLLPDTEDGLRVVQVQCDLETPNLADPGPLSLGQIEALLRGLGSALFLLLAQPATSARPQDQVGAQVAGAYLQLFASRFDTLQDFARRSATDSEFPLALFDDLTKRRETHAGLAASEELELSLFDLRIHRDHIPRHKATQLRVQVLDTFTQIRREQSVLPHSYWTRIANFDLAIFVDGRAARLWERDFARAMATELFALTGKSEGAVGTMRHLRSTFWATAERPLLSRLADALGYAQTFGANR